MSRMEILRIAKAEAQLASALKGLRDVFDSAIEDLDKESRDRIRAKEALVLGRITLLLTESCQEAWPIAELSFPAAKRPKIKRKLDDLHAEAEQICAEADGAWWTVDETACALGVSHSYVRRLCRRDRLEARRHPSDSWRVWSPSIRGCTST